MKKNSMRNVLLLGIVAVGLLVFGYYALFATPAQKMASEAKEVSEELSIESKDTVTESVTRQGTGSLEMLRLLGENLECKISYTEAKQGSVVEGTYFVNDGNMRGDFLTESPDLSGQILSSMIINETTMYIWSEIDGTMYGMKMDRSLVDDATYDAREPVPLDAVVNYDCTPWKNVDRTVFVPPSTVLFQEVGEMISSGMEYGTVYEDTEPQ